MSPSSLSQDFRALAQRSWRYSHRHAKVFGAIVVLVAPLATIVESWVVTSHIDALYVRVMMGCFGLPLLFHDRLPRLFQENIDLVWLTTVALVLPFSFGLLLTANAAYSPPDSSLSPIWVYQYLVALFILIQVTNSGVLAAMLWVISTALVFAICLNLPQVNAQGLNAEALMDAWLYPFPVYLTVLIIGSITNRNVHAVQAEQLRAASAIGSNIAHELRTPLASIGLQSNAAALLMPKLVQSYKQAEAHGLALPAVSHEQLTRVQTGMDMIQGEVRYANTIINMLLLNTSETPPSPASFQSVRVSEVVREAVDRFPFNNSNERKLLHHEVRTDFSILAPPPLMVHVLFNLIKNGLFYVQRSGSGSLSILVDIDEDQQPVVVVTDTGTGIPSNLQPHIFDRFVSAGDGQGAGIGLSFCKMVMESIGGEILCDSREGQYTTFRLLFPRHAASENSKCVRR